MKDLNKQYFLKILKKYRQNKASAEEIKFLESYYDVFEDSNALINEENEKDYRYLKDSIKKAVDLKISEQPPVTRKLNWIKYAAAAAIVIAVSAGLYVFGGKDSPVATAKYDEHILPGGNNAILTLANGKKIVLNEAASGEIARQSGISITKTAEGQIVYAIAAEHSGADLNNAEAPQNTISTPRGGQYKVILPDGTTVLLNAASSLRYPAAFNGKARTVQLEGEAYFEVAKNKDMPFRVQSGLQTVEVLGTHFNISAYDDENAIKTTLLEGAVKVASTSSSSMIAPGQQAVLIKTGDGVIFKRNVDTDKETAWKNGLFSFKNDDIKTVMRAIARWYNIDVRYIGDMEEIRLSGEIFRTAKLSEVLRILKLSNVQLKVEGKTIIVSNDGGAVEHADK